MANAQQLNQRLSDIHEQYRQHFAGRSRVTREPERLDSMIAAVQQVLIQAEGEPTILKTGKEREALYRQERQAIVEAKAGGPDMVRVSQLADWGFVSTRRYARNFAGRNRSTRDLGLLDGLIDEHRQWLRDFDGVAVRHDAGWQASIRELLSKNLELYEKERGAIAESRVNRPADEKVSELARRANEQFAAYRRHFANQPRRSRDVGLLRRIIANLDVILAEMNALQDAGTRDDVHTANIGKVTERLAHHNAELTRVQQAVAGQNAGERSGGLADAANGLFKRYREQFAGRNRAEVDPDALHDINEQLHVIARQMDALHREAGLEVNAKNLAIVMDNLKRYEREFERILEAKRGA